MPLLSVPLPRSKTQALRSPEDGSGVVAYQAWPLLARALRLSARELQIVQAVFDDRDAAVIAASLGITSEAVFRHLQRIYIKLRIGSRAELIARVAAEYLYLDIE